MDKVLDLRKNTLLLKKHFIINGNMDKVKLFKKYRPIGQTDYLYSNLINPCTLIMDNIFKIGDEISILAPYLGEVYDLFKTYGKVNVAHDIDDLYINPKIKILYIANPNPLTGRIYNDSEIIKIIDIVKKNSLFLIVNEEESGSLKRFLSFIKFRETIKYNLFIINSIYFKKNTFLSMIIGPREFIKRNRTKTLLKGNYLKIAAYYQSRRINKEIRRIKEDNYNIIKSFCDQRKIIYMKDSRSSYMIINIDSNLLKRKNILTIEGPRFGMGEHYSAIAMNIGTSKILKFVKRLSK